MRLLLLVLILAVVYCPPTQANNTYAQKVLEQFQSACINEVETPEKVITASRALGWKKVEGDMAAVFLNGLPGHAWVIMFEPVRIGVGITDIGSCGIFFDGVSPKGVEQIFNEYFNALFIDEQKTGMQSTKMWRFDALGIVGLVMLTYSNIKNDNLGSIGFIPLEVIRHNGMVDFADRIMRMQ